MSTFTARTARETALFAALLATAIALGGALAHAFALPNKIGMSLEDYFVAQKAYAGWNLLSILLVIQLISIVTVIVLHITMPSVRHTAILALAGLVAAQILFWTFTFPANQLTANWTFAPADWAKLREQWEFSHLAGAACQLVVMAALIASALASARSTSR